MTTTIAHLTLPFRHVLLPEFLRRQSDQPRFYLESAQSFYRIAARGVAVLLTADGQHRFTDLNNQSRQVFAHLQVLNSQANLPPPILLGGAAFFAQSGQTEGWRSFPSAALVLPRHAIIQRGGQFFLSINQPIRAGETRAAVTERLRAEAAALSAEQTTHTSADSTPAEWRALETDRAHWRQSVRDAVTHIRHGILRKVVLARPLTILPKRPVEPAELLQRLGDSCPDCFRFLFEFQPGAAFAGATPERLAAVQDGHLRTAAIAGSMRRGITPEEDDALARQLLESPKNRREHALVVDYLRARLDPLTTKLIIAPNPDLLRLPNIQHLRTPITGRLRAGCSPLDVAAALHPTPAVGGLPAESALDFIRRREGFDRGWYAGPVGWLDSSGNGDFAVAIRSALFHPHEITLFGGAGIVDGSDPDREWEETDLKMQFLLNAMQAVPA